MPLGIAPSSDRLGEQPGPVNWRVDQAVSWLDSAATRLLERPPPAFLWLLDAERRAKLPVARLNQYLIVREYQRRHRSIAIGERHHVVRTLGILVDVHIRVLHVVLVQQPTRGRAIQGTRAVP